MGLTLELATFHLKAEILNFVQILPFFSFNPNTFHSHFNCVLKALSICSFSYLKAASYKRVKCVPMFPNLNWEFKRFHQFSSVLTKCSHERRPVPPHNHLVRPDRLTPPWAKSDSPIAAKLLSSDLCQDINQIFFPLSSQHHNVRYWPSQLPSSIRPWTRTTRVPCHLITRLKPSYKSTFVGVILHVSAPSLNQSRFTPTSAYTSSFSDKYPPHYSSW